MTTQELTGRLRFQVPLLLTFLAFLSIPALGQDGWGLIRENNYARAAEVFTEKLKTDSTNAEALKGMIFLSETSGDQRAYQKYINTLLNNHWDENYFLLFQSEYEGDSEKIINKNKVSERLKIEGKLSQADDLYKKRKIEESDKLYGSVFNHFKWTFLGPFKSLNGSGHKTKFQAETDDYDSSKIYLDENDHQLKWIDPPYRNTRAMVSFNDNLNYSYSSKVYFANTFVELKEKRKVELRITRENPIKIWIDNHLVFESNDNTCFEWDNEILEVELNAGIHRILVKHSPYSKRSYHGYADFGHALTGSYYDDYDDYMYEEDDFHHSSHNNHYDGNFEIRLTDAEGKLIPNINSYAMAKYNPGTVSGIFKGNFVIEYFKQKINSDPENLFNYYALLKAFGKYEQLPRGEETLIKFYRAHTDLVFAKYLAYSIYSSNGKTEKAYEVLNDIDQQKTPIFDLLYQKIQEIDKVNDEEKYLEALDHLKKISPANYRVIQDYIDYYDSKDMVDEKEDFVKSMVKKYPHYEPRLKRELKKNLDEKKQLQKELLKNKGDYSYKKDVKELKKDVKQSFYAHDYIALIGHYKNKDDYQKVMNLFDELLKIEPYEAGHYHRKAQYLFDEEKYDMAIEELNKALKLRPYNSEYFEMIGDIYYDKKEKEKALNYYRTAKKLSGENSGRGYYKSKGSLADKIEKIEGQKQLKKLFQTPSFQDILKKDEWKDKYKEEESVILMYTRDVVIDSSNHGEAFDKIMIKILNDAGIQKWVEYDFSFLGHIKSAKIIKTSGAEVIPEGHGGFKVFKNLEPGDIIQLEGGFQFDVTNGIEENNYFFTYMSFEAPIYYSKFEVALPEGKKLGYLHHKIEDNLKKSADKGYDYYKWEYYNLPKIANEEATIDKFDLYSCIMISMVSDWNKIASWYDQTTYRKLESNYEVKEILDSIIQPGMNDRQKVEKIYNFLTREIKYSFVPFLQSGYVPKDPGLTVCSRIGDCKDVATLMITMLREVGIESYYVLVKTNDYFHEKMLPCVYFNHVIAGYYLDGKLHFSDMTTDFYPYYILPEMDANAWALLIKDGNTELFQLPKDNVDQEKNKAEISVNAKINPDRSTDLAVTALHRGIIGGNIREKFAQSNKEEQKNYIMDMMGKGIFDNVELRDYKFYNMLTISDPLKSDYQFNIFNYCDRVSGMLVFRIPYMTPVTAHPAILSKTRFNSLNLKDIVHVEPSIQKLTIEFPQGYEMLEIPKDIYVESKYGIYKVTFKKIKNGLYVEKYQAFTNAVVDVKEFQNFKKFYLEILDFDSSKIALKKK